MGGFGIRIYCHTWLLDFVLDSIPDDAVLKVVLKDILKVAFEVVLKVVIDVVEPEKNSVSQINVGHKNMGRTFKLFWLVSWLGGW